MQHYESYLYIAGGDSDKNTIQVTDFYRFDLTSSAWEDKTNANTYESITLSGSVIYQNYFYVVFGWRRAIGEDTSKIFRTSLTDPNFVWSEVADFTPLARDSFSLSIKDGKAYSFGGFTVYGLLNDLITIDLTKSPIEYTKTESVSTPSLRVYHSFEPIYGNLYVFGGDSEGEKLSDLWAFDISMQTWSSIESTGSPPTARSSYGSTSLGDSLIIWGGQNESGYLNDMFKYSVNSNSWEELVSISSLVPTPRAFMCVVLQNPYIFLYGGVIETGLSSELWMYDIGLQEYQLLDSGNRGGPSGINKHKCAIEETTEDTLFYVMFGTGLGETPKGEVHYFSIKNKEWTLVHKSDYARNGASVSKVNDKILVAGGETWGIFPEAKAFLIDLSSCSNEKCSEADIGELDEYFMNGASAYYLNHIFIHGGSSPLTDIIRANVAKNSFYKIDLSLFLDCSLGSESNGSSCEFCSKGHYRDNYNTDCMACPSGFFNKFIGSSSFNQCFPCEEGSFNPNEGAYYCLDCPAQAVCSIGSSAFSYESSELFEQSSQPDFYEYRTQEASDISLLLILFVAVLGFAIILIFAFWKRLHKFLVVLDMFDSLHTFGVGNVVTLTKNRLGGIFTIVFYVAALILVVSTLPSYAIDNLIETKALVPYIIVDSDYDFFSELKISVDLQSYYAPCVVSSDQCDSSIQLTMQNIEQRGELSQRCVRDENNCIIELMCEECAISSSSSIEYQMSDLNSYSSGIKVNITTFSSIPEKYSSVSVSVFADTGVVFRGSQASEFFFNMVSSVYKNSITGKEETGYHSLITNAASPGSTHSTLDIPFTSDMLVHLELSRSENCLMTLHDEKNPLLILLFTLLGSISGALGAIGAVMANTEKFYKRTKQSVEKKKNAKEVMQRRNQFKIFLTDRETKDGKLNESRASNKKSTSLNKMFDKNESKIDPFD